MPDTEFDAFTRADLIAEITAMRLKLKDDAAEAVALETEEEMPLLSEITAEYHAAARLAARLPLDELLARLDRRSST